MAEDKRDGDDLFEDLDKFFAPIQDVDWPESGEPEPTPASAPREEHVTVHASETHPEPPRAEEPVVPEGDDDEADDDWYDTTTLESMASDGPDFFTQAQPVDAGQAGLFAGGSPADEDEDEWPAEDAPSLSEPVVEEPEPTGEDVEAAAAHFASSIEVGAVDEPQEPFPTETGAFAPEGENEMIAEAFIPAETTGDLMGDLGGTYDADEVEDDILSDLEDAGSLRTVRVGAEGLGGPSWQEPTSMEVGADIDRRGPNAGERDVPAAFMTGLVLAGVALGALIIGKGAFALVAAVVVLGAQFELFRVMQKHHHQPATFVGLVTGALIVAGAYYKGESAMLAMFALGVIATFLWFMAVPAAHRKNLIQNVGLTILNMAYIPLLAGYLLVTLALGGDDGKGLVITVIGLTFVYDTGAFLVGAVWGGSFIQRSLAPDTSPKKSWEGALGATLITIVVSMALVPAFVGPFQDKRVEVFFLAVVVSVMATFGDLAESLIKRDVGIKDMGSILPGHGGILDRIDSLLFVAPAAFLLFRVIFA